jgi:hypothetical protein
MPKYRKKPVVIEAWRLETDENGYVVPHPPWINDALMKGTVWYQGGTAPYMTIETLEGDMRANIGDWIIKGVKGELYPCKHEIFEATYEKAE